MHRLVVLVGIALAITGCIENRATAIHAPDASDGMVWLGDEGGAVANAPLRVERSGHLPQSMAVDGWRERLDAPLYGTWLSLDRVSQHTWPTPLPLTAWLGTWPGPVATGPGRRWLRAGDVGSPASVPRRLVLERTHLDIATQIPWWQCFPCDIGSSFVPYDLRTTAEVEITYLPVETTDTTLLRTQALAAGYPRRAPTP